MSTEIDCRQQEKYSVDTKCQLNDQSLKDAWGAVSYPIYQTATFAHKGLGESTGFDYTRMQNPTRQQLEAVVALLENGKDAIAFASGMAAVAAVMELFSPGDHFIIDSDLYGGSVRLFNEISKKNGLTYTTADLSSEDVIPLIKENTKDCSNVSLHIGEYYEWITPHQAREAVEIAREEVIEQTAEWLAKHAIKYYFNSKGFLGTDELVEDYKLIMTIIQKDS